MLAAAQAPFIADPHWRALPPRMLATLWNQPAFRNAWGTARAQQNVFGSGASWSTFNVGGRWFGALQKKGSPVYQWMIYMPVTNPAITMRGLNGNAILAERLGLGQLNPQGNGLVGDQSGNPNVLQVPSTTITGQVPGSALSSAAQALDSLLQSGSVPGYTPGQGPSNPTVLAFQQAWNNDPIGQAAPLQTDGEYGTNTQASMGVLGYQEPQPNILGGGGSGTKDTASTQGYTGQPGGSATGGSATIMGIPTWALLGGAGILGAAMIGAAAMKTPQAKRAQAHVRRAVGHARTHARALHSRARRFAHR
jgi:hypothetical protein